MRKVLVVDDDLDMLDLVRAALEKDGHLVDTETDGTALQPSRCQQYDLLLLDVMMPGEDGFSVCGRIRAEVDCPILFLTARAEDAALVQGFGLGADDYIKKPFSIAELRARVNAHLRREVRQPAHTLNRGGVRFDMQAKMAAAGGIPCPLPKENMPFVNISLCTPVRSLPKNNCTKRSSALTPKVIHHPLPNILRISVQN